MSELKQPEGFELFLIRKYNSGQMTAGEFCKINLLLGEYEKEDLKEVQNEF